MGCALLGLLMGYWINQAVYRLPRAIEADCDGVLALIWPPAQCPTCQASLGWYEKIPLLSFALQRGHCRHCGGTIAWRYPLVEAFTALLYALLASYFGWGIHLGMLLLLVSWLLALLLIDWHTMLLPDVLTLSLLWLGLLFNLVTGFTPLSSALYGAMVGYALLWTLSTGYALLRKQEGMGLGDAKLLAALGAWLGWGALPQLLMLASLLTLSGVLLRRVRGKTSLQQPFPFGPGLALAGFWIALLAHVA